MDGCCSEFRWEREDGTVWLAPANLYRICIFTFYCVSAYVIHLVSFHPSPSSAAGEFFPEAAQVAYQMWELSAVAKVEVRSQPSLPLPVTCWLKTTTASLYPLLMLWTSWIACLLHSSPFLTFSKHATLTDMHSEIEKLFSPSLVFRIIRS